MIRETQPSARLSGVGNLSLGRLLGPGDFVRVDYWGHVEFHNLDPLIVSPERRRRLGRLVYDGPQYVIVVSDEKREPPSLKGGDPAACGPILRQSVGWPVVIGKDHYVPASDRSESHVLGEKDAAGYKPLVLVKDAVVEIRRLTSS